MKSRTELGIARRHKKMEGVNMPASSKSAWRWLIGTTFAAIVSLGSLPGIGHAENIEICITPRGRIKGINLGIDQCNPPQVELDWVSVGPAGVTGPTGVSGNPGIAGAQGPQGAPGIQGPAGPQGAAGPQGPEGAIGPTGPTGPAGVMGTNGIRGQTGVQGVAGETGVNGIAEPNITFFTGGTLGTLGFENGTDLSGFNSVVGNELILGPGNGSDITPNTTEVPMADAGTAERLFVNVDNSPGTQANNGQPSTYFFELCDLTTGTCGPNCDIVGPETACSDLTVADNLTFSQSDLMYLVAFTNYPGANHSNVKWSVTYNHGAALIVP